MSRNSISINVNKVIKKISNYFENRDMVIDFPVKGIILNYHRVADLWLDPWALAVSPTNFSEQLAILKKFFIPVRLEDLLRRKIIRKLNTPWVVITFDDGYSDNAHTASHILRDFDMPATFFLTSNYIGQEKRFWWDILTDILLEPGTLPNYNEKFNSWNLSEADWNAAAVYSDEHFASFRDWNYLIPPPTPRHHLFLNIYEILRKQTESQREQSLEALRTNNNKEQVPPKNNLPLSIDDAIALSSDELFEIGAHSIDHADFRTLSIEQEQKQLFQSKKELERLLGMPINSFAYPHGGYQRRTLSSVRKAGFSIACTIKNQIVSNKMNRYILPRIPIINMPGKDFEELILKFLADN